MGAWGPGLFSDDTACDVRNDWIELYGVHGDPGVATTDLLNSLGSEPDDPDAGPVIWLALAVTQWKHGCLLPEVRDRALEVIDKGLGLDEWKEQEPADFRARVKVYEKTREQLTSPQPARKKVTRKPAEKTGFKPGQILRFTLRTGDYALLWVRATIRYKAATLPECVLFAWVGTQIPTESEIRALTPVLRYDAQLSAKFYADIAEVEGKSEEAGAIREYSRRLVYSPYALTGSDKAHYPADRIAVVMEGFEMELEGRAGGATIADWSTLDAIFSTHVRSTGPAGAPARGPGVAQGPGTWTSVLSKDVKAILERASALAKDESAARAWPHQDGALVLKKSRTPAKPGDLFVINLRGRRWVAGRVVLTDACVQGTGEYIIYFYDLDAPDPSALRPPIAPKLLIPPQIGGPRGWTTGSIVTLGNAPMQPEELLPRHIFESGVRTTDKYFNEYGVNVEPPGPEDRYVGDRAWSWPGGAYYDLMEKLGIPTPREEDERPA